jgi:hypothetical protein
MNADFSITDVVAQTSESAVVPISKWVGCHSCERFGNFPPAQGQKPAIQQIWKFAAQGRVFVGSDF